MPDPNDDLNLEAADYWLERCEWYRWPVRYFDSPQDLYEKLKAADFQAMHHDLAQLRERMEAENEKQWAKYLA